MKTLAKVMTAGALTGLAAIGSVVPASAQDARFSLSIGDRDRADRTFGRYCDNHRGDRDCERFRSGRFNDRDRYDFYNRHRTNLGPAAAFFGFTLGAIFAGAAANAANNGSSIDNGDDDDAHIARCEARFRSYDRDTDQYLGYDGDYHTCTL